jgi:hypothetical protein
MKLKHILILQNKIDLVKESQAKEQYEQILAFVQGEWHYPTRWALTTRPEASWFVFQKTGSSFVFGSSFVVMFNADVMR